MNAQSEKAIRAIVKAAIEGYASGFSDRHLNELNDPEGTINMKIHNVFIAALGADIQYYSALARSFDSSLGNMIEKMAINIATLNYTVSEFVEGYITSGQIEFMAHLLEEYKSNAKKPSVEDYKDLISKGGSTIAKKHESDYCLKDEETGEYHLIELKIGGDLDNKKAKAEKEAILEQYCILSNSLGSSEKIKTHFATAYNRYGEGNRWKQTRVLQFFAEEELLISSAFWNMICKSEKGYEIVLDEYQKNAYLIVDALAKIKKAYLPNS